MATLRDLDPKWLAWLGPWVDEFNDDLAVVFYDDDGDPESPDVWAEAPHLAISPEWRPDRTSAPRAILWPVGVEGWDDLRVIGWAGAAERLAPSQAGRRAGPRQAG